MSQPHRLPTGGRIARDQEIHFTFNGQGLTGCRGDTLASALLANGIHFVGRSFKYHRPRGIMAAGVEEPNALVQLESGSRAVPNARATEVELYEGLSARSINARPDLARDRMAIAGRFSRFIAAGFYYKTFMWPKGWWPRYEKPIRNAAGLGEAPTEPDADVYDKRYVHCDVLVVGAGPAGLAAATAAGRAGARVLLVDHGSEPGGSLLGSRDEIDGAPATEWVAARRAELAAQPRTRLLLRTTLTEYQHHNYLLACERRHDHLPLSERQGVRERFWHIRARHVILATGAHERPLVFGNNDLPGILLAGAVSTYINRWGVLPGRQAVVFANNDSAYQAALDLKRAGAQVTVVDARPASAVGVLAKAAAQQGVNSMHGALVAAARGGKRVSGVTLAGHDGAPMPGQRELPCDLLAVSGGWSPVIHLYAQSLGKPRWDEATACFVPGAAVQQQSSVGAASGDFSLAGALDGGARAGLDAARALLPALHDMAAPTWQAPEPAQAPLLPLWRTLRGKAAIKGPKQFIDFQNDVSVSDIELSAREGFQSIEHVKRYTAMGFGTDQGKLGNINGMAVLAEILGQGIAETDTTTYRPNYTPVSFGAFAGRELGDFFDPIRKAPLHDWNAAHGALFEDVGQWKRAHYYPQDGEDMHAAVRRECLAVRNAVGLLDYSTLGKIDVRGPDAVEFLNRMYINSWTKLKVGRCRYGLMMDENGIVLDDGVSARLAEDHFFLTTTTGGAARVLAWMERWLQTEWTDLQVYLTSVSEQYAVATVAGPRSRQLLREVCADVDLDKDAFPFMSFRNGSVDGIPVRVQRVSFSGELSYEVYSPSGQGRQVWERLFAAGQPLGVTSYGTEAMHVLRAEKGFIIVGQDTDGAVTPVDVGYGGMVAKTKDCLGKRSLARSHTADQGRRQLVGLLATDPQQLLPEGGQILEQASTAAQVPTLGHVTSSYISPALDRTIALALVVDGRDRMDQTVTVATADGHFMPARISGTVFYDPQGERQNVD